MLYTLELSYYLIKAVSFSVRSHLKFTGSLNNYYNTVRSQGKPISVNLNDYYSDQNRQQELMCHYTKYGLQFTSRA